MMSGEQNGTKDSQTTNGLCGSHGAMLMPMMYGITMSAVTGPMTEATSSCRETSEPNPASTKAYEAKPTTNHTSAQAAVLPTSRVVELTSPVA